MDDTDTEREAFFRIGRLKLNGREFTSLILVILILQSGLLSYWIVKGEWGNSIIEASATVLFLFVLYLVGHERLSPRG